MNSENSSIHFRCPGCATELTVPSNLAGVQGPCPACGKGIRAPKPQVEQRVAVTPRETRSVIAPSGFTGEVGFSESPREDKSFTARKAIDPEQAGLGRDDSWKERHRERARHFRKRERWDNFFGRLISVRMGFVIALFFSGVMGMVALNHHQVKKALALEKQKHARSVSTKVWMVGGVLHGSGESSRGVPAEAAEKGWRAGIGKPPAVALSEMEE